MDVRLARPTDAPLALALALDDGAHLVKTIGETGSGEVARTVVRACIPVALPGRVWLAGCGRNAALLEAVPRRYVIGWDITRLAVRGDRADLLGLVVHAVTKHVQSRGVPRLFARCSDDSAEELKTVAFYPLAREYVLHGPESPPVNDAPLPIDSRYRMPQDAWPLHQLETDLTPPHVRQMEGLTSLDWSPKIRRMQEIVVERDSKVVCWIGWGGKAGKDRQQIGLLVRPHHGELAADLLVHVLRTATANQFQARVRDYQQETLETFLSAGFRIVAEEILMVKHARMEPVRVARSRLAVVQAPAAHIMHQRHEPPTRRSSDIQ